MASAAPPSEFFSGINFNLSFYTAGDSSVTLNYVNANFLKCTGYAYSRAISTTFNNIVYFNGGFQTTNITATGTITANLFSGSGSGLTNINASNVTDGILSVAYGGTGVSSIGNNRILFGSGGSNPIRTLPDLTFNGDSLTCYGEFNTFRGLRWGSQFSRLNRVLALNQFATGTAIGDIVLISDAKLHLIGGSDETTPPGLTINALNNIGIGITTPAATDKLSVIGNTKITGTATIDTNLVVGGSAGIVGASQFTGNVGIGTTPHATYKLNVNGTVNATTILQNGVQIGGLTQGMTVQTKHLTYTQMDVKNNTGWDAINDNLTTGFVIAITPASTSSKVLVNMIAHIGTEPTTDSRWWGIKLYRKIGAGGAWTEITGANGTETGAYASTAGTPVWVSNNMGSSGTDYQYFITNVSGTYLDYPNTTSIVYYTAYWNQRIGDASSVANNIYLNRAYNQGDAYRPAPSSSWTATEIWDLGTLYVPPVGDTTITTTSGNVGIGTAPNASYKLDVGGNINTSGTITASNKIGINGGTPTLYLRHTSQRSAMIHCNSNILYFLGAPAGGDITADNWSYGANNRWPLEINLNNNDASFGGHIIANSGYVYGASYVYSSGFLQGAGGGGAYRIVKPDSWVRLRDSGETTHLDLAVGQLYSHNTLTVASGGISVSGASTFINTVTFTGGLNKASGMWYYSTDGYRRVYYGNGGETYYEGGGDGYNNGINMSHVFRRQYGDADIFRITTNGSFSYAGTNQYWSDIRIKKEIEDINDDSALLMILAVEPKTYKYIDGNKSKERVYGFIAQQIQEVIPEAVVIQNNIIPNIYKKCRCEENKKIYITLSPDVSGKLIQLSELGKYKIVLVENEYIEVEKHMQSVDIPDGDNMVYGYEVDDFHTINKDYIYTLNVCATQELHRRMEAQEERIKELERKLEMVLFGNN